ncbi:SRPBCC domain-containing protein [Sporosarcina sp. Te-1]|uniref:SRPBCC domain-containing protein n=1 Tax=Sporosarcina sp. Te-1 TaxID=2818390 RepID=UPI001A9E921A|nr:SRPBCC domain-containing protein [Sporosarcina sp. Te-1]QTD40472.1 SRPBCC domain-containing protein [Sporosarcina sp. Te-1]
MEKTIESVKREIFVKASPEKVWKALTVPEERNRWETRACELDIRVGGSMSLDYGWGVSYVGTIKELVEYRKILLEDVDGHVTKWTITPQEGGSLVGIEYIGSWCGDIEMMEADNMAFGTYQFMRNLKSVYEEDMDLRTRFWKSWIGVLHRTNPGAKLGAKVVAVQPDTPAEGFVEVGDIITHVNGITTATYDDVEIAISESEVGERILLRISRGGEQVEVELTTIAFGQTLV